MRQRGLWANTVGGGILRCLVHYWMYWGMRTPEADVKREIPVVLLATEVQEAEVCTLCHYTSFEDVLDREKTFTLKHSSEECSRQPTVRTDRREHTACWK